MAFIDLTGQVFGDLKVIERNYEYGKNKNLKEWNKKTFWNCVCLICNEKTIKQGSLLRTKGEKTICPKCGRSKIKIGQKYGMLTILSRDNNYKQEKNISNKVAYFKCKCDCGEIITKRADSILKANNPNCGCFITNKMHAAHENQIIDLTKQKFGLLTVLEIDKEKSKAGQVFWKTLCDCGNFYSVCGKHLKRGATVSCGCIKRSFGEQKIEEILKKHNINFIKEYKVPELNYKRFDFAILNKDNKIIRLIEYDGEQHFSPSSLFGEEEFIRVKESDKQKNDWAKINNIPLIRIPYTHKNNITYSLIMEDNIFLVK